MQGKLALGGLLQRGASRPFHMGLTGGFMGLHTQVPDLSRFHLSRFQALEHRMGEVVESVDFHGLHGYKYTTPCRYLQCFALPCYAEHSIIRA